MIFKPIKLLIKHGFQEHFTFFINNSQNNRNTKHYKKHSRRIKKTLKKISINRNENKF